MERVDFKRVYSRVAFYDLSNSPTSYDFLVFVAIAKAFCENLHVVFVPGFVDGFKEDAKPISTDERFFRINHILIPACTAVGATYTLAPTRAFAKLFEQNTPRENIFPHDYSVDAPTRFYTMKRLLQYGAQLPSFMPTKRALDLVVPYKGCVTVTLRETYNEERNSNIEAWLKFYEHYRGSENIVFIRDTEKANLPFPAPTLPAASLDMDVRLALYDVASMNMGVTTGPMGLTYMCPRRPYLLYKMWVPKYPANGARLYDWGFPPGSQFPWRSARQEVIWDNDDADVLIRTFAPYAQKRAA